MSLGRISPLGAKLFYPYIKYVEKYLTINNHIFNLLQGIEELDFILDLLNGHGENQNLKYIFYCLLEVELIFVWLELNSTYTVGLSYFQLGKGYIHAKIQGLENRSLRQLNSFFAWF